MTGEQLAENVARANGAVAVSSDKKLLIDVSRDTLWFCNVLDSPHESSQMKLP